MEFEEVNTEKLTVKNEGNKTSIKWKGHETNVDPNVAIQAKHAWKLDSSSSAVFYFEVLVKDTLEAVGVGISAAGFPKAGRFPGWDRHSYAYHGDDGKRFSGHGSGKTGWPTFGKNEVVGIGLKASSGEIFATLNGKLLGMINVVEEQTIDYFPIVGFNAPSEVEVHFSPKDFIFPVPSLPASFISIFGQLEKTERVSSKFLVLYVNGMEGSEANLLLSQLEAASKRIYSKFKYQCFFTSETKGMAQNIREIAGVYDRSPVVLCLDLYHNNKYELDEGKSITTEHIEKLVEDVEAGRIKTISPPCVEELVIQNNYKEELVDVLVDYDYTKVGGTCRIEILDDNIAIAQLSCGSNTINIYY